MCARWDERKVFWDKKKRDAHELSVSPEKGFMKLAIIPHGIIFLFPSNQIS